MNRSVRSPVVWFRREDWGLIKRTCSGLQDTFDEWLATAEKGLADLSAHDFVAEKVILEPSELRKRYQATGRKIDGAGRAKMALEKLIESEKDRTVN